MATNLSTQIPEDPGDRRLFLICGFGFIISERFNPLQNVFSIKGYFTRNTRGRCKKLLECWRKSSHIRQYTDQLQRRSR